MIIQSILFVKCCINGLGDALFPIRHRVCIVTIVRVFATHFRCGIFIWVKMEIIPGDEIVEREKKIAQIYIKDLCQNAFIWILVRPTHFQAFDVLKWEIFTRNMFCCVV